MPVRHEGLEPGSGLDQFSPPFFSNSLAMAPKRVCRVALFEPPEEGQGTEVGPHLEEVFGGDLPGHHALLHAVLGEGGDHFPSWPTLHPLDMVHQRPQSGVRFAVERHGDQRRAPWPGLAGQLSGKARLPAMIPSILIGSVICQSILGKAAPIVSSHYFFFSRIILPRFWLRRSWSLAMSVMVPKMSPVRVINSSFFSSSLTTRRSWRSLLPKPARSHHCCRPLRSRNRRGCRW